MAKIIDISGLTAAQQAVILAILAEFERVNQAVSADKN